MCKLLRIVIRQKYCRRFMRRLFSVSRPFFGREVVVIQQGIPKNHKVIPNYDFSTSRPSSCWRFFSFTTNRKGECYENQKNHPVCCTVGGQQRIRKMRNHELSFRNMHIKRWCYMRRWQLLCLLRPWQQYRNNYMYWHIHHRHIVDLYRHHGQWLLQTLQIHKKLQMRSSINTGGMIWKKYILSCY